jgi:hypothetical protein
MRPGGVGGFKNLLTTNIDNHQTIKPSPRDNANTTTATTTTITSPQEPKRPKPCLPPIGNNTSSTNSSPAHRGLRALQPQHHETHRLLAGTQRPDRALTPKCHEIWAASVQQQTSHQRRRHQQQLVECQTLENEI